MIGSLFYSKACGLDRSRLAVPGFVFLAQTPWGQKTKIPNVFDLLGSNRNGKLLTFDRKP